MENSNRQNRTMLLEKASHWYLAHFYFRRGETMNSLSINSDPLSFGVEKMKWASSETNGKKTLSNLGNESSRLIETRTKWFQVEMPDSDELTASSSSKGSCTSVLSNDEQILAIPSAVTNNNSEKSVRKSVTFGIIEIREYAVIADINPAVSSGPAIGLGWNYNILPHSEITDFGSNRHRRRAAVLEELKIPRSERESMLREFGFDQKQINEAVRKTNIAKRQRESSIHARDSEFVQLAMLSIRRKLQKTFARYCRYRKPRHFL